MLSAPDAAYARLLDVSGALALLVALALLLERALALVFEYHWFRKASERIEGLKSPVAFLVSWYTCRHVDFDVLSRLFPSSDGSIRPTQVGILITAAVVAGGSAAAITLFQGVLHFGRDARVGLIEANRARTEADLAEARSRRERADTDSARALAERAQVEAGAVSAMRT